MSIYNVWSSLNKASLKARGNTKAALVEAEAIRNENAQLDCWKKGKCVIGLLPKIDKCAIICSFMRTFRVTCFVAYGTWLKYRNRFAKITAFSLTV